MFGDQLVHGGHTLVSEPRARSTRSSMASGSNNGSVLSAKLCVSEVPTEQLRRVNKVAIGSQTIGERLHSQRSSQRVVEQQHLNHPRFSGLRMIQTHDQVNVLPWFKVVEQSSVARLRPR